MLQVRPFRGITLSPRARDPLSALRHWPANQPAMLVHSGRPHERWARWSILARPAGFFIHDGRRSSLTGELPKCLTSLRLTHDPLGDLDAILDATRRDAATEGRPDAGVPFTGGWIGSFSYELGRAIEPVAGVPGGARDDRGWPLIQLAWCPDALVFDNGGEKTGQIPVPEETSAPFSFGSSLPREAYLDAVKRTIEYIGAGDIFQANISQRLTTPWCGSPRRLAAAALARSEAWYGAYLELPGDRCVVSLSPELFLSVDPGTRQVTTRPIKGTRPSHVNERELIDSVKDAAELHMIIDLMRNDLGRVCEFGSVRVPSGRTIETHPTVHHGVGEVQGTLRAGVSFGDLLRATFPGGSITGAPKIRAMQIIDELEPVQRGPYCGAIGMISNCGRITLNIAIRTLLLSGSRPRGRWDTLDGTLDYGAGGGIVADSDPVAEYEESLAKAEILNRVLRDQATKRLSD